MVTMRKLLLIITITLIQLHSQFGYASGKICGNNQDCIILAQASTSLPNNLVNSLQKQFNGRIISVNNSVSCRDVEQEITINGDKITAKKSACMDNKGKWTLDNLLDIQILSHNGNVIIITVNPNTGEIINTQE